METKEQPKLIFKGVDFPTIELKSIKQFAETDNNKIKVEITPHYFIPSGSKTAFNIILRAELSAEEHFTLKVVGIGSFEITQEVTNEERKFFINANATAIVFPYVRAMVSMLTSNVGKVVTPVLLPTRFFKGDLPELQPATPPHIKAAKTLTKKTATKKSAVKKS